MSSQTQEQVIPHFRWTCRKCDQNQPEYCVDGSPISEVMCEQCCAYSRYHVLTLDERRDWDRAQAEDKQEMARLKRW